MKVILQEDVGKLGTIGDVVNVADGDVALILDGVDITKSDAPAIQVDDASNVIIYTAAGTTNAVRDTGTYDDTDDEGDVAHPRQDARARDFHGGGARGAGRVGDAGADAGANARRRTCWAGRRLGLRAPPRQPSRPERAGADAAARP